MARLPAWALMSILLFITSQIATCEDSETFHIIPSMDSPCLGRLTGEPCFTLSQYLSGEYRQYTSADTSEIVLKFQPGHHRPGRSDNILASQLASFTMTSAEINCDDSVQYLITNVQNVRISGIDFVRCNLRIESVMNLTLEASSFSQAQYSYYYFNINYDVLQIINSLAKIKGCNFSNNDRFPLYIGNSSMELHNTTFVDNKAGGALFIRNTQSVVSINHCSFVNNSAYYSGGAIFTTSSLFIQHSRFINNQVSRNGNGGAIYAFGVNISIFINQSDFMNNSISESGNGGAIYVNGGNSSVSIHQSMIGRNSIQSSTGNGGAVFVYGGNISIFINQSDFMNNSISGSGNGGAIYASGGNSSVSIHQSMIGRNSIQSSIGNGGAVYVSGGNNSVSIYRSVIDNNSVQHQSGGAVFFSGDSGDLVIEQSSLNNNKVLQGGGGAIFTSGQNTYISITETTMTNNSATECGALDSNNDLRHQNVEFVTKNSMFVNNSALTNNGGVLCIRNASIFIRNATFSHNRAAEHGGVFTVDDSIMTIEESIFDNNTAGVNGGVLNTEYFRSSLFISHTSFTNNQAAQQGGVLYLGRKRSQVRISRSQIHSNNATRGGFATVIGSSLEITTSVIFNNTAETGEVINECNSGISVSDQLYSTTDPIYSVCTLISGYINDTSDLLMHATTEADTVDTETAPVATTIQSTEPSVTMYVYFELNGKVYLNNSVIPLSEVGENENALLCKTDLVTCCGTPPNRFGEFYYPDGATILIQNAGHGFYRNRGVQEVRLNRREGVTSPTGKFHCAVPDASGMIRNLYIHLLSEETMQP